MKKLKPGFVNLITILNDGHYHDGSTIGEKLNISRSAVWKAIKKLKNYQIKVESIKGKGYALLEPLVLLNQEIIIQSISDKNIQITVLESIDSTNEYLKRTF